MPICKTNVPIRKNFKRRNEEEGFFYGTSRQKIWNPRPVIDLLSRAITESGGSFLLVLLLLVRCTVL
jgi:hypothetical protein